jgi:hypothetical protein
LAIVGLLVLGRRRVTKLGAMGLSVAILCSARPATGQSCPFGFGPDGGTGHGSGRTVVRRGTERGHLGLRRRWARRGDDVRADVSASGAVITAGSETDADEDAAFALLMAAKQWGVGSYQTQAKTVLAAIWSNDTEAGTNAVKLGSTASGTGAALTNPSYFAPAYYRVFAAVDTAHNWMAVVNTAYTFLANITATVSANGLVPGGCQSNCTVAGGGGFPVANEYQYDAHRTPWRIGVDLCWNNDARAATYVGRLAGTSGFFTTAAQAGLGSLGDIYTTAGSRDPVAKSNSMSLIGTMGVGAMAAGNAALAARAYRFLLDASYSPDPVGAVPAYTYANATAGLLAALTLSGNFMPF